jgi:hypothetical protein
MTQPKRLAGEIHQLRAELDTVTRERDEAIAKLNGATITKPRCGLHVDTDMYCILVAGHDGDCVV